MTAAAHVFVAVLLAALVGADAAAPTKLQTTIGMEGVYFLRYAGGPLEAKPLDDKAPIILRIGEVTPVDAAAPAGPKIYELRYVGTRAGRHDLRDFLVATAGQAPSGVEPIPVTVTELLPPDHTGDLEALAAPKSPSFWSYQALFATAVTIWSLPIIGYAASRLMRRRKAATVVAAAPQSIEGQLQALAVTAGERELNPAEQAQLERLLIRYWRECLELRKLPPEQLLAELARNPQTSALVKQLESWLYQRPGTAAVDVAGLLEPYRRLEAAAPARSPS